VKASDQYYVYVSELAAHTAHLLQGKTCSILFIEDESQSKNIFARRRLTLECQVEKIERETALFNSLMDRFADKFGNLVDVLRSLQDFHLFCLSPEKANFVAGFAQAYCLEGKDFAQIRRREGRGSA
jgi:putative heme iron utilization protein